MFRIPHLIFLSFLTSALVVFIFTIKTFLYSILCLYFINVGGQGTDRAPMGLFAGKHPNGRKEKHVGWGLCLWACTLGCQDFGTKINLAKLLGMRYAPSNMKSMPSLLIRPGLPKKVCQLSTKLHC